MRKRPKSRPTTCSPFSRTSPASCGSSPARARSMLRPRLACACASSSIRLRPAFAPESDALEGLLLELLVVGGERSDLPQKQECRLAGDHDEAGRCRPEKHPLRLLSDELSE